MYTHHISQLRFLLTLVTVRFNDSRDIAFHLLVGMKKMISEESWQSRAKLQGSVMGHRWNLSKTSGGSENEPLCMSKGHIDCCYVGDGDWLVRIPEPNIDCASFELPDSASSDPATAETDSDHSDYHEPRCQGS